MAELDTRDGARGKIGAVMVVGGGIGGMQAALDLANAGFHVTLVEETTAIGGRMAQLDKTFPTNDCSMCTISPKLIEVDKHLNIDILTSADVLGVEGEAGDFRVRVRKRPRYVDLDKCNSCGDCLAKCPVAVPSEFDMGTMDRKAIFKRYPQAIPGGMAISKLERPPCVLECPAGVNCQGYVALVGDGRFAEAYALIRERNPFPAACGRICHHPCEEQCNRRNYDQPVAINHLKRFVADWVAEKRARGEHVAPAASGSIDRGKPRVAIVGGGPAGLTAARDMALRGYPVTLFEAQEQLGGTMFLGVPSYRLPEKALAQDIADVLASGFDFQVGKRLGRDFTLESLRAEGFRAVFLALGCTRPATLTRSTDGSAMRGTGLDGVLLGLDFLADVKRGRGPKLHGKVVVIGGGNVAIDVAMTARRQGAQRVEIVCLESREEMPAHEWEILDALEEGITLNPAWGPQEFVGQAGRVRAVKLQRCVSVLDEQGQFAPRFDPACFSQIEADFVIVAIGQRTDFSFLQPGDPLWDPSQRRIHADPLTLQTNVEWVFAGGDMISGPASVVEAVAHGHEAAESMDRYLTGRDLTAGRKKPPRAPAAMPQRWFPFSSRAVPPRLPVEQRTGYEEIDRSLDAEAAIAEAKRCMACGSCSECLQCVTACTAQAIVHDMLPEEVTIRVGAILLAPGFDPFDPAARGEYGHGRYPNVVTSLEFERILSASGPYQGHVRRPSDHAEPKRIAWIQCVGSRDRQLGNDYCSGVCCMYAVKQAIMATDHVPGLQASIFHNDIRAHGKGFESYFEGAKAAGVQFRRGIISSVKERRQTGNLAITCTREDGRLVEEEFDLVVLSVGMRPSANTWQLAKAAGIELDRFGFCPGDPLAPGRTGREGIYAAGTFAGPMDIPETVMTASAAAALAAEYLREARGTQVRHKSYPPERSVAGEEPRIGVFVCRCGTNIARVVGVSDIVEYARSLPHVAVAEENLYTCSTDTQKKITDTIRQHRLNRVVVASCTPRTHEPLFQETLREAGLNKHLFEMANIRDQCSWVHFRHPQQATSKAKDLVRMAVARAATLDAFQDVLLQVDQRAIVLGGGVAGMTAAISLAEQGFEVSLVEREQELGGIARQIRYTSEGADAQSLLADLIQRAKEHPRIRLYTAALLEELSGHVGKFTATLRQGDRLLQVGGGAVIVATGGAPYQPVEYGYPESEAVITQLELEEKLQDPAFARRLRQVVMIQCVGSREEGHAYCSRVCCQEAVKNALALKRSNPNASVFVLFRDMRTYGFHELEYLEARDAGVVFIRFEPQRKPLVRLDGGLQVHVTDDALGRPLELRPDLVVLSAGIRPHPQAESVSRILKVPLNADGFFLEAHMKLRPLDFGSEGIFLAGLAHAPKTIAESISQARGAAARAATILSQPVLYRSGTVSEVDAARCAACLTCVRLCPYHVPVINEEGVACIEPASCQGCGVCASACPRKAIVTRHYRDEQLLSSIDALFSAPPLEAAAQTGENP